ncbi:PAS domain S-box protein [Pedobacter sp.]
MISPSPISSTEEQRLAALYSYDVLGEGLQNELDNLVKLAAQIASTKKAYISFIDRNDIVFKATYGLITQQRIFNRAGSICQYAMYKDVYVAPDLRLTEEFHDNALKSSQDNIIFYASVPLIDTDGYALGCLCVVDDCVQNLTSLQIEALQTLSLQIITQLSLRRKNLQLEVQTKRSEEFINVFEASPEIHCILNRDGDILFTNQAAYSILGYQIEEVLGKSMWSFCYKEDVLRIATHIENGLKNGQKQFSLDFRVVDKQKRVKWLSWSMAAKDDRWYSYGRDITEKKRLDMELTHLSFVASKVNNGVVISDDYNRVSWANDAFTEITGFTLQDIQGKPLGDLIRGPETDWSVIEEARKLTSEKKSFTVDVLAYKKDKTKIWLSIYSTIILSADGEVETEIEIIIDITAKKKAEQELEVLSTVARKTHTGVAICDKNGEITWVNEALEQLIGYSAAELSGKMLGDVLSNDETDRQVVLQARAASEHKKSFSIEVLAQTKKGQPIWLEVANTPIINAKGQIERYIELITDITERKQVERDIIQAKEQATQLSEAKEMFLSVMSHEIRTPLNAIIGMTNLLIENDPKQSQKEDLNILKFSGENLLNIINDVLDFTKIETGNLHLEFLPVNLQLLCNDIISSLKVNATKQQNILSLNFDEQIPTLVSADKLRLYQVLMNLLGNAVKFTTNGRVELTVKMQHESTAKVDVYFEVKDNGIGIPLDKKDYIFETFTQARADISRKYGGTGLGLAITKKLLKLYQSDIKVDSVEGKGASFSFVIGFDKVTNVEAQEKLRPVVFDGKRVLIVDDNEINIVIAMRILIKWGFVLDFAADGYEAIEKITKNKYDLVFMDIKMPGITGFETTTIIRGMEEEYYRTLPIVALTASTLHNQESKFKESGMNGHILKPFNPSEIKQVLAQFLV